MTNEAIVNYFQFLGYGVEEMNDRNGSIYLVVRSYAIPIGPLAGRVCDVAIQKSSTVPYVAPAAIHTKPHLITMGSFNTQGSNLGPEWQYWSRKLRDQSHPRNWVTHIATIFSEVTL